MRYVHQKILPPLYLDFNISFYSGTPISNITSTATQRSDSPPRVTYPTIFSHLSTSILTKCLLSHSEPPQPPIRHRHIRIPLLALPTLRFFRPLHLDFNIDFYSGTSYLQRHLYNNTVIGSPSSRYPPYNFFPSLYLHCNKFN